MQPRLILRLALVLAVGSALAAPAFAAEEKAKDKKDDNGLYVDLAQAGLSVVQNGRLVNYVFAQVRLILAPGANPVQLRAKEPYFRDALVHAAFRTPFTIPGDPNKLDEAALKRALRAEAAKIAGPRAIASIVVVNQAPKKIMPK
jgi:hypothetical protein